MSGCIERMADALELTNDLPEAVTKALEDAAVTHECTCGPDEACSECDD